MNPKPFGISGDRVFTYSSETELHMERRRVLEGVPGGIKNLEPFFDQLSGRSYLGCRNGGGADDVGTADVVVLDAELDVRGAVSKRQVKMLIPLRVFVVGYNLGASDGCAGDDDGDIGIAGNDFGGASFVMMMMVRAWRLGPEREGEAAGSEAAAEMLRKQVLVWEVTGFQNI